jgi:hypothetical protein
MRELEKRRAMQKIKMDEQLKQKQKEAVDIINKFCDEFDKDGDGDLDPGELKELLRRTSKTPPSETALSEAVAKVPSVSSAWQRVWAGSVGSWVGGRDMNMDTTPLTCFDGTVSLLEINASSSSRRVGVRAMMI